MTGSNKTHTCPECGRRFPQKSNMEAHRIRKHTNEKRFECPHCVHKCNDKANLARHIASKHVANRTKKYQCSKCGNGYYNERDLHKHVRKNVCGVNNRINTGPIPDATIEAASETSMHGFTTNTLGHAQAGIMEAVFAAPDQCIVVDPQPSEPAGPSTEPGAMWQDTEAEPICNDTAQMEQDAEELNNTPARAGEDERYEAMAAWGEGYGAAHSAGMQNHDTAQMEQEPLGLGRATWTAESGYGPLPLDADLYGDLC
jgi:hypothetical protein